ncbi:hypothetical protein [Lapidilactobacillus luobeiensis]|uniref:hypothetical protein n=1 Tax=Lapidilactobacillus luobeiensis TaxID=2950371 RepID=UPI0021C2D5FA|nr:hypothetical protein [Lapidilactobacillus luobeiensis]
MVYVDKTQNVSQINFLVSGRYQSFTEYADANSNGVVEEGGRKILPIGSIFPSNDAKAKGITLSTADVTNGAVPVAVMVEGYVLPQRLAAAPTAEAKTALAGIKWRDEAPTEA